MAQSSAGMGSLVKWGLIGLVGWYVYETYFATPVPAAASASPAAPVNTTGITGANTLSGVFTKMQASAPSGSHSIDEWDVFLVQAMQDVSPGFVAPDPEPLFVAAVPGWNRSQQITAAQYWAVLGPWLKTNKGLTGVDHFARLAGLYGRRAAR